MQKFIQVIAYEAGDLLAFDHKEIEAESLESAYDIEPDVPIEHRATFRNWYIISLP
jgi:hypothetical protein